MVANLFGPDLGIVVVVIIGVLLAGSQLPKIARNVGSAGREFRKAQQEAEEDAERESAAKAGAQATPAVGPATVSSSIPPTTESSITLSRSELDALLKAREDQTCGRPPARRHRSVRGSPPWCGDGMLSIRSLRAHDRQEPETGREISGRTAMSTQLDRRDFTLLASLRSRTRPRFGEREAERSGSGSGPASGAASSPRR